MRDSTSIGKSSLPLAVIRLLLIISLGVSAFRNEIPLRFNRPAINAAASQRSSTCLATTFREQEEDDKSSEDDTSASLPRRNFVLGTALGISSSLFLLDNTPPALARGGLVQFPCTQPLGNTYYFLRVGETLLERDNVLSTNPLFLTNREAALSPEGVAQIQTACQSLRQEGVIPTVVRYSFAAACQDTARILGDELNVGQDRLIPEFFFLDPRAIGQWDQQPLDTTEAAVWALDVDEAKNDGQFGRPPANDDSTPHETLGDHAIRLRQLFSACETVYSGDTVVLIFPDGTGPALLSCMIAGIPFNKVHELELQPGEVRRNVNRETALALLKERQTPKWQQPYQAKISKGREEIKRLLTIDFRQPQEENKEEELASTPPVKQSPEEARPSNKEPPKAVTKPNTNMEPKSTGLGEAVVEDTPPVPPKDLVPSAATKPAMPSPTTKRQPADSPSLLQESLPLGVVGLVGTFVAMTNNPVKEEEDNKTPTNISTKQEASAEVGSIIPEVRNPNDESQAAEKKQEPGLLPREEEFMQEETISSIDISPMLEEATIIAPTSSAEKKKRLQAAQQAMEDYLEEDDGGDAWLQSLTDIIATNDEDPSRE